MRRDQTKGELELSDAAIGSWEAFIHLGRERKGMNKPPRLIVWVTVLLLVATMLQGCSKKAPSAAETAKGQSSKTQVVTIKLGHCHPPESEFHLGSTKFAELVAQKTNGQLKIEVYHSSQLGDEPDLAEGIRMGTMDMALLATGNVAPYESKYNVFDLPYLFQDHAHADKVLAGEVGKYLAGELEKQGIKVLSYWESGFRHYLNNKRPLKSPEDLKGLKIRVPNWPVLMDATRALGANCTPMPFNEVYLACQQGVVDGQEGPAFAIKSAKMYEVQKYMVLDGHTYTAMVLAINPKLFASLTPEQQQALTEAAEEAGQYERKILRENEAKQIEFLETEGKMIIEKNPDKGKWLEATKSVYDKYQNQFGQDLIQKIINTK